VIELHSGNQQEWMPLVKKIQEIKPELKDSPLVAFLESHKFWKKLDNAEAEQTKNLKFIDGANGHVF
jgi:hypothetical protein